MKKLLVLTLLVGSLTSNSQVNLHLKRKSYDSPKIGPLIALGGTVFTVGGILAQPDLHWICNKTNSPGLIPNRYKQPGCEGRWEPKPFLKQGPKMIATITGVVVLSTGIVITIGGK